MHCASLGEFEQGRPVIEKLRVQYPGYRIVITFFSPSGFEVRKNYEGADEIYYLPMDSHKNARRFISNINPALVLWVKYEYWHYYLQELKQQNIPVLLVSGIFRNSQPFFKWYGGMWRNMLNYFEHLFVQDQQSYDLAYPINNNITISGDTRFDRVITIAERFEGVPWIPLFCRNTRTIVAGSTWEADEAALVHYANVHPEIMFIIAPHEIHEEHLSGIKKLFKHSIYYSELAEQKEVAENIHVLIIDNIGMLSRIYHYADVTYVGGGFNSSGIHNSLEAAVHARPVIFGPVYEKFTEARGLIRCGGAFSIESAIELEKLLDELLLNPGKRKAAAEAAGNFVYENRGASDTIMNYVAEKRLLIR